MFEDYWVVTSLALHIMLGTSTFQIYVTYQSVYGDAPLFAY